MNAPMYVLRPVLRLCRGLCQASHCHPARQILGSGLRSVSVPALHSKCSVRRRQHWLRPSTPLLADTSQKVLQYGSSHSVAVTLSGLHSAADLSAAVAAAPTPAALQSLAAGTAADAAQQSSLAQEYKVQLLASLEQQQPAGLAKALLFYAGLGPEHADLFQEASRVLYSRLSALTPQDLVHCLSACATAAQHSPAAYSPQLFAAATEFLREGLGQLEPCGLADVAGAYAAVQHYDDDEDFFDSLAAAALQRLQSFCPEELSRLCRSLAELHFSAPKLNAAALQHMAAHVEAWPVSCIGRLLGAAAAVQAVPDPGVLDRVAGHVSIVLRNLRTSTDGQRVLASLGPQAAAADKGASKRSSGFGGLSNTAAAGGGVGVSAGAPVQRAGGGPTWQGFGMSRSGSSSGSVAGIHSSSGRDAGMHSSSGSNAGIHSSSSGNAGIHSSSSSGSSSVSSNDGRSSGARAAHSSSDAASNGTARIWAAANISDGYYKYLQEQGNFLGPDYMLVTSCAQDGKVNATYSKRSEAAATTAATGSASSSSCSPESSSSNSIWSNGGSSLSNTRPGSPGSGAYPAGSRAVHGGVALPQVSRALSSSTSSSSSGEGGTWARQQQQHRLHDECRIHRWQAGMPVAADCRPVYGDAGSLQAALVDLCWAFAMMGHLHSTLARECVKGLALVLPQALSGEQLARLWGAQLRYQQLGHATAGRHPQLTDSYSVFMKEVSRAAPRTVSLPPHLQPLAAAHWLLHSMRQAPEYECQQHDQQQQQQFSSCKLRDPAVLTQRGLEASVRQALLHLGLPVGAPCLSLDGAVRVGLPLKYNGVAVAWQVVPPAWCSRNPPHTPTAEAQAQAWALQYRGYTVLTVPFHEWAAVLESGDVVVQAGYLQSMLNGLSLTAPRMANL